MRGRMTFMHWNKPATLSVGERSFCFYNVYTISLRQVKVAHLPNRKLPFRILSSLLSMTNGISLLCGICRIYSRSLIFVISGNGADLR